jgi:cytochrome c
MQKLISAIFMTVAFCITSAAAHAQTATKEEALALLQKAVVHVKKNGVDTACKDFADPKGGFINGELYVFVEDMEAKMICNAGNSKLNGKDLSQLKDADGKQFSKALADLAKTKGSGSVDYRWVNPVSKAIEAKTSFVERVNDTTFLGVGIYKK